MLTAGKIKHLLEKTSGRKLDDRSVANMLSAATALAQYSAVVDLTLPHRYIPYLAQLGHESNDFFYDREVWGPTPAQQRYDTRTDLGNTPERDGDGFLYRGRTAMQATGKANYGQFTQWARRNIDPNAPDFVVNPDAILTDPWEGLFPMYYWASRKLNKYADQGDMEMISRRINGGLNGYGDRLRRYDALSLVELGLEPGAIKAFQGWAKPLGLYNGELDGITGPRTRSAMHRALVRAGEGMQPADVPMPRTKPAPVETKEIVVPKELDKPVSKTSGWWERIAAIGGTLWAAASVALEEPTAALVIMGGVAGVLVLGLLLHKRIINAVKYAKQELQSDA